MSLWIRPPRAFYTNDDEEAQLAAYVAQSFYVQHKSKGAIAKELGQPRGQLRIVNEYLEKARKAREEGGIVDIKLNIPHVPGLSIALGDALGKWHFRQGRRSKLQRVRVVAVAADDPALIRDGVANRATQYLIDNRIFSIFNKIGLVGGQMIRDLVFALPSDLPAGDSRIEIYPLSVGGPPDLADVSTNCLVGNLASKLKAVGYSLNVPPLLKPGEKDEFLNRDGVREVLQGAEEVDCAIMSVGTFQGENSTLWRYLRGYGKEDEISELSKQSPGDLNYTLLDWEGNPIDHPINQQVVGVPVSKIKEIAGDETKISILLTSGVSKADITLAVLKGDFFNALFIDEQCARAVLDKVLKEIDSLPSCLREAIKRSPGPERPSYTKDDEEAQLAALVAYRFYEQHKGKGVIAEELGKDGRRPRIVNDYLEKAENLRIAEIKLNIPEVQGLLIALRDALGKWHLRQGRSTRVPRVQVVAVADDDPALIRSSVANKAAEYLSENRIFSRFNKIGLVGGQTIRDLIFALPSDLPPGDSGIEIYPLSVGGPPDLADVSTNCLVGNLATKLKAVGYSLTVPPFLGPEEKDAFLKRPGVREVLQDAQQVNCAIMSVGTFKDKNSTLWRYLRGYGKEDKISELSKQSPGDLNYTLLDSEGKAIDHPINQQVVGVPISKIKDIAADETKISILLTSGVSKADITLAVLKGDFFDVLFIDEQCAIEVLDSLERDILKLPRQVSFVEGVGPSI